MQYGSFFPKQNRLVIDAGSPHLVGDSFRSYFFYQQSLQGKTASVLRYTVSESGSSVAWTDDTTTLVTGLNNLPVLIKDLILNIDRNKLNVDQNSQKTFWFIDITLVQTDIINYAGNTYKILSLLVNSNAQTTEVVAELVT